MTGWTELGLLFLLAATKNICRRKTTGTYEASSMVASLSSLSTSTCTANRFGHLYQK